MKTKRVVLGHVAFYTSSWKEYFGAKLCSIGIHDKRTRKNGNKIESVCKRKNCEYYSREKKNV